MQSETDTNAVAEEQNFTLKPGFREELNELARNHYHAHDTRHDTVSGYIDSVTDEMVGVGSGRVVMTLPKKAYEGGEHSEYVVKIAEPNRAEWDGRKQNQLETQKHTEDSRFLPVIDNDSSGYWNVMPRGKNTQSNAETSQWLRTAIEQLTVCPTSTYPSDVVTLDGDVYLCDYGVA